VGQVPREAEVVYEFPIATRWTMLGLALTTALTSAVISA
jgi:hypothetical protein